MGRSRSYVLPEDEEEKHAPSQSYHIWKSQSVSSMMGDLASFVSADLSALESISNRLSDQEVDGRLREIKYKAERLQSKALEEKKDAELSEYKKQVEDQNKKIEALEERFSSISTHSAATTSSPSSDFDYDAYLEEHPYHEPAVKFAKAAAELELTPTRKLKNGQMGFKMDDVRKIYEKVGDEEGQEYLLRTVHNNDTRSANIARATMLAKHGG